MAIETHVKSMQYTGGLIGALRDKQATLQQTLNSASEQGYRLRHVLPPKLSIIDVFIQLFFTLITFTLWAPMKGETLIFERID